MFGVASSEGPENSAVPVQGYHNQSENAGIETKLLDEWAELAHKVWQLPPFQ